MAQKINSSKLLPVKSSSALAQKINSSKLLPVKSSSALVLYRKPTIKPLQFKVGSSIIKRENKEAQEVNNKLAIIDNFFKSELLVSRKKSEQKREDKERKDFESAEKKLETPKSIQFKLPSISIPKLGFMDRIKRFLFFTAVGWLFPKILDLLPKLEEFAKKLEGVGKFFGSVFEKLHGGFQSLVKFGGDLKDKTLGFIGEIPGVQEFGKKFIELENQFSLFTDAAIIASVLAGDIGLTIADELGKLRRERARPVGVGKPSTAKPPAPTPRTKVRLPTKPGIRSKAKPKAKPGAKLKSKSKPPAVKPKPPSFWDRVLKGPFAKLKGPLARFGASVIPGLGAVAGAADAFARFKTGDKVGGTLASISASLDGIAAGLALTGIGAPVGAAFAAVSMSIDALLLIRDVIKEFFPFIPMFSRGGRVVGKYQGGGTTRGGRRVNAPIRRTITPTKSRPPKIKPQKSIPGKDVGGEGRIKKLYPNPTETGIISLNEWSNMDPRPAGTYQQYVDGQKSKQQKAKANPYKVLTTAATKFKELPMGLGNIVGAAIDSSLGQKVDVAGAVGQFSSGLNYLFETYISQRGNISTSTLSRNINSFADGGFVSPGRSGGVNNSMNFGDMISKVLEPMVNSKINDILDTVKKELQKKSVSGVDSDSDGGGGDGGGIAGGEYGGYALPTGIQKEIYDYLVNVKQLSDDQALGLMANIHRESGFRPGIQIIDINGKPSGGLFQWNAGRFSKMVQKVPDWKTNWKGQIDWALDEPWIQGRNGKAYISKTFSSAQEAADWWMTEWEVVRYPARDSRKHAEYLRTIQRAPAGSARFRAPTSTSLSPGNIPKAGFISGTLDLSGEPGFDVTWKGNNNIAILPGRVKEIGKLYGGRYGNVVVVESTDPVNGKKVDVLYAHFPDGGISVREGQQVNTGQVLGRMGKPGERGIGNISGQHASIDFYEPNTRRGQITGRYSRWQGLSREIIRAAQNGGQPSNSRQQQQTPSPPGQAAPPTGRVLKSTKIGLGTVITIRQGTNGQIQYYENGKLMSAGRISVLKGNGFTDAFTVPTSQQSQTQGRTGTQLYQEFQRSQQNPLMQIMGRERGGLIAPSKSKLPIPNSYASYENGGSMIAIQPIIMTQRIPISSGSMNDLIMFPVPISVNSNTDTEYNRSRGY